MVKVGDCFISSSPPFSGSIFRIVSIDEIPKFDSNGRYLYSDNKTMAVRIFYGPDNNYKPAGKGCKPQLYYNIKDKHIITHKDIEDMKQKMIDRFDTIIETMKANNENNISV